MSEENYKTAYETVLEANKTYYKEIERLNNIIKEVREYIEEMNVWCIEFENFGVESKGLLEILDKENNNER